MSLLGRLGELLRVRSDEVEAVLRHDESRARETVRIHRRGFLGAAGAIAAAPFVPQVWLETVALGHPDRRPIRKRVHRPFWDTLIRTAGWNDWNTSPTIELVNAGLFTKG